MSLSPIIWKYKEFRPDRTFVGTLPSSSKSLQNIPSPRWLSSKPKALGQKGWQWNCCSSPKALKKKCPVFVQQKDLAKRTAVAHQGEKNGNRTDLEDHETVLGDE